MTAEQLARVELIRERYTVESEEMRRGGDVLIRTDDDEVFVHQDGTATWRSVAEGSRS